jgi:hypothetical protein
VRQIHGHLRHAALVPASGHANRVYARLFQFRRDPAGILVRVASGNKVAASHPDRDGDAVAHLLPHRGDHLSDERHPGFGRPAVAVRPQIGQGREELPGKIAGIGADLNSVKPRGNGPPGRGCIIAHQNRDLLRGQLPGRLPGEAGEDGRGRDSLNLADILAAPGIAPLVDQLRKGFGPARVDHLHQRTDLLHEAVLIEIAFRQNVSVRRIDVDIAHNDQPNASGGSDTEKVQAALGRDPIDAEAVHHGGHNHTIFQLNRSDGGRRM